MRNPRKLTTKASVGPGQAGEMAPRPVSGGRGYAALAPPEVAQYQTRNQGSPNPPVSQWRVLCDAYIVMSVFR